VKTTVFGGVESAALDMTINPLSIIPTDLKWFMGAMTRESLKSEQPVNIYRSPPVSMIACRAACLPRGRPGPDRALPARVERPVPLSGRVFTKHGSVILRTISVLTGSSHQEVQAMKPEQQFLERWKSEHIDSGTQQSDASRLVEDLLADAEKEDISRDMLVQAAGGGLVNYIVGAIKEAVEEELW
jgi:hypothetical protein